MKRGSSIERLGEGGERGKQKWRRIERQKERGAEGEKRSRCQREREREIGVYPMLPAGKC